MSAVSAASGLRAEPNLHVSSITERLGVRLAAAAQACRLHPGDNATRTRNDFQIAAHRKRSVDLKPSIDIDGYFIRAGGFTETGAGAFGLTVADSEEALGASTVSLGAGYLSKLGDVLLHPYIEAGYTRLSTDSINLAARFQGAPAGVGDFAVATALPEGLTSGRIGLEALMPDGSLRLEYEHRDGGGYLHRSISAKVRFAF